MNNGKYKYHLVMNRLLSDHAYYIASYKDKNKAIKDGRKEEEYRGGKYEYNLFENLDETVAFLKEKQEASTKTVRKLYPEYLIKNKGEHIDKISKA